MHIINRVIGVMPYPMKAVIPVLCPGCRREGNFVPLGEDLALQIAGQNQPGFLIGGQRVCPNNDCATHVFVFYEPSPTGGFRLLCSYPTGRADFDSTGVPKPIAEAFDEALICAANECHVAAGMLIRKTLEAVCEDRSAKGKDLRARISDLRNKVTLPNELFEAMDHLRLLGNDAAHIEAKNYDNIGEHEVAAGLELAKEIIKATYQYKGLVGKLRALQKP